MKGEEAMQIFNLVKARGMLPAKMEELVPLTFIGAAAVSFYRSRIKLMDQLKMTEEQRAATLRDGQDAGELLLDIEARVGELLPPPEDTQSGKGIARNKSGSGVRPRLPEGITGYRAGNARAISKHPEVVERVKAQARENEDIPTRTAVINQIRYEEEKKRQESLSKDMEKTKSLIAIEQVQYINKLDQVINILPQKPPKDWNDKAFKEARAKAKIIIKRLEVFNGSEN